MIEAISSSDTSVVTRAMQYNIPEDDTFMATAVKTPILTTYFMITIRPYEEKESALSDKWTH
jgi:hypothetical protein